ncbi:MAG: CBO0543 family protein [Pseudomonadota bacterium]
MEKQLQLLIEQERKLSGLRYAMWLENGIFTVRWWLITALLFLPWVFWFAAVDKRRLQEMTLYAFATSLIAITLDEIGSSLQLWIYPIHVIPLLPRLITINYTLVPIIYTLVYQHFPTWKVFIAANLILAFIFAFVLEPILVWAKLYVLLRWQYAYSAPLYFFAAVFLKWFMKKLKNKQGKFQKA